MRGNNGPTAHRKSSAAMALVDKAGHQASRASGTRRAIRGRTMKSHTRLAVLATIALLTVILAPSVAIAAFHGAAATKQTNSPVQVGDPYTSRTQFFNIV